MSAARRPKPATTPAALDVQLTAVRAAVATAEAAHKDADAALADLAGRFIRDPAVLSAYVAKHGEFLALSELLSDLRHHEAEVREALERQRAWEADQPKRDAEARHWAIQARPDNGLAIAQAAVAKEVARQQPYAPIYDATRLVTPELVDLLPQHLRLGGSGEPQFVALDPEAFAEYCRANASALRTGELLRTLDIKASLRAGSLQRPSDVRATRHSIGH